MDMPRTTLPAELEENLHRLNPHWHGLPGPRLPKFRRTAFDYLLRTLERPITPAVVLRGPRRVGKTVLVQQILEHLLSEGLNGPRILYIPFDQITSLGGYQDPILAIARWFEETVLGQTFNQAAQSGPPAVLLFDEVQNVANWAPQLKNLVDNHTVRALVTGSSSLQIEAGRDSLAGRITTLTIGPLQLREIAGLRYGASSAPYWPANGLPAVGTVEFWRDAAESAKHDRDIRHAAFRAFSERGAYPLPHEHPDLSWPETAAYLNETVVQRVIQHDLRRSPGYRRRDEALLELVFRLCCRYAGQAAGANVFVPEIRQGAEPTITWDRVLRYLRLLDSTLLVRLIRPIELRLKRQSAPAKIVLCDPALRASWLQEQIPLDPEGLATAPHLTDLAGRIAESVLGYFLTTIPNVGVAHFPARGIEPEVDFVLTVGARRIPIEVKYRRTIDPFDDTRGLRAFLEKTVYNAPVGLLVTLADDVTVPDPRIVPIPLSSILWLR